eukprot:TRINITY_DN8605_c0_g1_i1.p1 TRINITY_DN8605_c0_g1~~TRINITY_DN8605_c0_g1_i1.p1  ORF type:complete len:108 (-),score=13.18 TRINITY_DN8605_c0_g1_i1:36-359(-)
MLPSLEIYQSSAFAAAEHQAPLSDQASGSSLTTQTSSKSSPLLKASGMQTLLTEQNFIKKNSFTALTSKQASEEIGPFQKSSNSKSRSIQRKLRSGRGKGFVENNPG